MPKSEEKLRKERKFFERTDKLPFNKRVSAKIRYAGGKYEPLNLYDGCRFDEKGEPQPEIGIFGIMITGAALPYYIIKEAAVDLKNKYKN